MEHRPGEGLTVPQGHEERQKGFGFVADIYTRSFSQTRSSTGQRSTWEAVSLIQPFWAIAVLAVAKLEFREIMGWLCLVFFVY